MSKCLPGYEKRPARIGLEDCIPLVQGDLIERNGFEYSSVVHQHVNPPMERGRCCNCLANRVFRTHVALDGLHAPPQCFDILDGLCGFSF